MSEERKLRMAAIDFSHGHQFAYTRSMLTLPMIELVALADADAGRRSTAAALVRDQVNVVSVYEDYRELLERDDVQAVVICSPNVDHYRMTLDSAEAGKHVLCEKPLALTVEQADEMIRVCKENNVVLGTAYPCRFSPVMWDIKRIIDNGGIGSILYMSATNHLGSSSPDRPLTDWFIDPARSGGGCVRDHIVHAVDLCRWFSGSEPVEVYAEAGHLAVPHLPVEDTAILIVRLANGIVFTIDPSWNRPRTWTRWGDVTVRVVGSDGAIEGDLTAQAISRTVDTARWVSYDEDMNEYLLRDFASAILEGRQPLVSGADGRAGVATTLAAYESIRTMAPARIL